MISVYLLLDSLICGDLLKPFVESDMAEITNDDQCQTCQKDRVGHTTSQCGYCQNGYSDKENNNSKIFQKFVHGYR